jgi:hypothetical protein
MLQVNNLPGKKLYGLLVPIIVLLRLAPRDCWLVVVLGQDEGCHCQWNAKKFVFVAQRFKRTGGSEFQKMHVEFCVNILALACSAQESDKNVYYFIDNFLAHLQDQYLWSWRFCFAGNALVT